MFLKINKFLFRKEHELTNEKLEKLNVLLKKYEKVYSSYQTKYLELLRELNIYAKKFESFSYTQKDIQEHATLRTLYDKTKNRRNTYSDLVFRLETNVKLCNKLNSTFSFIKRKKIKCEINENDIYIKNLTKFIEKNY